MDSIILENFRCFRTYQEVPLAPLTFLVGENSTGKTSFLAAVRLAWDLAFGRGLDFNEEPFDLGSYEQIASFIGGKSGRSKNFTLGFSIQNLNKNDEAITEFRVIGRFDKLPEQPQPELCEERILSGNYQLHINKQGEAFDFELITPSGRYRRMAFSAWKNNILDIQHVMQSINIILSDKSQMNLFENMPEREIREIAAFLNKASNLRNRRPHAFAPIRTKPSRTYDPKSSEPKSTGDHIPVLLAKIKARHPQKGWAGLHNSLVEFGNSSGLFKGINVKSLGKPLVDPFQLQIKVASTYNNLVDVGYGVSQILPILIEGILSSDYQTFLLQQPEVHLHPRAQAQFGTLIGTIVRKKKLQFVVETHSDHLIDRIRLDIRANKPGGLKPEDVLILYFERDKKEVKIYPIRIDRNANVLGAPPSYRSFFMQEEMKFWE